MYTIVNYSEHIIVTPESMHNVLFIIVAHLNKGAFITKCVVSYDLTELVCKLLLRLQISSRVDILDDRDNYLGNIKI